MWKKVCRRECNVGPISIQLDEWEQRAIVPACAGIESV